MNATATERPILFNGDMVRAILAGKKVQTRRPVKPQPPSFIDALHDHQLRSRAPYEIDNYERGGSVWGFEDSDERVYRAPCLVGDVLWVRETWMPHDGDGLDLAAVLYAASFNEDSSLTAEKQGAVEWFNVPNETAMRHRQAIEKMEVLGEKWRPSIHLPRWAARIFLRVTDIRVQRVQETSEEDAIAEGVDGGCLACGEPQGSSGCGCDDPQPSHVDAFAYEWMKIYGEDSWHANPWVWAITFERIDPAPLAPQ